MQRNITKNIKRLAVTTAVAAALSIISLAAGARPALACPECESKHKPGTYTGEVKQVGNGVAYSWVKLDEKGKPSAIGVTISETAMEGLPTTTPKDMLGHEFNLMLPPQAEKTPFNHIRFDWNPGGHEPPGIYDTPHFDIHFYMVSPETRRKITAKGEDIAVCRKPVAPKYAPQGYIYAPGTEVPEMGGHFIDPKAPEMNGQPFTKTFLYGAYNGDVIFWEPMITKAFLETKPDYQETLKVPAAYATSAFYPTTYSVRYDAVRREYTIAMENMKWRDGSDKVIADAIRKLPAPKLRQTTGKAVARRK